MPSRAATVAVATPCWPAPVSAITRRLPIRSVQISLDGDTQRTYAKQRIGGALGMGGGLTPLHSFLVGDAKRPLLVLLGAFTKSAQFPFHFWLPQAMAAPTPVSAYLHSATMVKAGVFLLARMWPVLAGTEAWFYLVATTGLITMLIGAVIALFKDDLKALLAYSTVSHLGLITMLFGLGVPSAAVAGVFHIINHATFKASLFMAAGIIDHETGSRDMRRINGMWKYMPHTAILAMVALRERPRREQWAGIGLAVTGLTTACESRPSPDFHAPSMKSFRSVSYPMGRPLRLP